MELGELLRALDHVQSDGLARIERSTTLALWTDTRNALVGRQSGQLTEILGSISKLAPEYRQQAGLQANAVKKVIEAALEARRAELAASSAPSGPALDLSMRFVHH